MKFKLRCHLLALCIIVSFHAIQAQVGPYPAVGPHPRQPRLASNKGYTTTNAWYSNWMVNQAANQIQTYPYVVKTAIDGFRICYASQTVTAARYVVTAVNDNWQLFVREAFGAPMIDSSTVNSDFFDLAAKVNFGTQFDVTVIRGHATILANFRATTPVFKTIHAILQVVPIQRSLKVTLNNGQTWLIQSQNSITWQSSATEIWAPNAQTGWVKISIVTSTGAEQQLEQTIDSVVTTGHVSYTVNRVAKEVDVTVTYNRDGVYYVLPHMTNAYSSISSVGGDGAGIKGVYKMARGTSYTYKLPIFTGANPQDAVNTPEKRTMLCAAVQSDVQTLTIGPKDPYFGGKAMAKVMNVYEIAGLCGDTASQTRALNLVINELDTYWFAPGNPRLVYEPTWGGIVSRSSVGDFDADFGNYVYNDHHFHYGYFIYVASVLAKYEPALYNARVSYFEPILADYAGTCRFNNLPCQPRNKDAFLGFSFAGGLNEFGDSKDQESTSEGVNSYLSVRKLAQAINNRTLEDLADYLLSSEIVSSQTYWHITQASNIYSAPFKNNGVVGIVWETKVDYTTWFGANTEFIWAIQMLPVTDISTALLTKSWLAETRSVWRGALNAILPTQGKFADILLLADAIEDATRPGLAEEIHGLTVFDDGNCRTNQLYIFYMVGGSPVGVVPPPQTTTPSPSGTTTSGGGGGSTMVTCNGVQYVEGECGQYDPMCPQDNEHKGCYVNCNSTNHGGCYRTPSQSCFSNGVICNKPYWFCGGACYDITIYSCINNTLYPIGKKLI